MKKTVSREMAALNNLIKRYLDSNKININKITCTNVWILAYIAENQNKDIFQRDIERDFSVTRSTASRVVDLMVQKGLLERQGVPHDARLKKLSLTDRSREIVDEIRSMDDDLNIALQYGISDEELDVFYKCIDKMKANLCNFREEKQDDKKIG